MALVDYSSSDSAPEAASPPAKRRRKSPETKIHAAGTEAETNAKTTSALLPPLPDEFHDLYASTVRTSTADNPALHQGRKRTIPHIAGNWPSHVYIEWHPTASQHALLTSLVSKLQSLLGAQTLHPLLASDLNAPLPLHISLSRPLSLPTPQKDAFLTSLSSSLPSSTVRFALSFSGIGFFKSPDSDRAFLVLRVADPRGADKNPQLRALLTRSNDVALRFGHPALYQGREAELADDAFHVSIGWTFGMPSEKARLQTTGILDTPEFRVVREWEMAVAGVKVKIGNVVTHVPLVDGGKKTAQVETWFE